MNEYTTHKETIRCPECGCVQEAVVEHTRPWYTYIHFCDECGYCIMESEWETVEEHNKSTDNG